MSDYILEEAQKGFREILEGKVQETWGKYLTEDKKDEVLHAVAELVAVYLVSLERRWCIANPDRISIRFRGLIESILQDAFSRVGAFVIADNLADFSADVFNQIKLIIDDHSDSGSDNESDNGAHAFTVDAEDDENDLSNAEYDEEASNGTSAMAVRLSSPGTDSIAFESDEEMESDTDDENVQGDSLTGDPITTEDEAGMEDRFHFSTPTGPYEGHENIAVDTLFDEDMADTTPTQEGVGNDSLFSSVAGSDKGDQDMADDTYFDGGWEDNDDLFGDDMGHYSQFSFPARDEDMVNHPHAAYNATNKTPAEVMAINTAGDQRTAMEIDIDDYMANDTSAAAMAGLEEENEDVEADNFEDDNQVNDSSTACHAMDFAGGHKGHEERDGAQQSQDTPTKKGKGAQQGPRGKIDPRNNSLYSAVMDEKNPTAWPPKFYKCKIVGCEFQGSWYAKQVHFEIKHPMEWKEATGCEAKVYECPVDECEYTTTRSNYIARHVKSKHPESEEAQALGKKQKKSKK
ncbi:hypothetical protein LA080_011729 [Diaporthe eres]|nr:hypothetical protein LA080_011729 [Diaporthe eres]